ncbi:DUF2750 domain-containing protein [Streptomyces sp. NBC_00378]|uniref:DUF2750 domain-containing protein n=1 Tax=unclassified Streptomyces TaxID=2593676 RepID=UPI0022580794|nr:MULTISPECIES: DUF2750 domain-containing protein [unclassified Streptomyces]MCX5115401.1 DUF2750 domain-containing protein [Streptomyces sp. NBC_00378]
MSLLDRSVGLPFWSTSPRAQRAAKIWGHGLRVESMTLDTWCDRVLPDAARDEVVIGINWSGPRLVGWSFTPRVPRKHVETIVDGEGQEEQAIRLGSWIGNQRSRAATLSPERAKQLSAIGMRWA